MGVVERLDHLAEDGVELVPGRLRVHLGPVLVTYGGRQRQRADPWGAGRVQASSNSGIRRRFRSPTEPFTRMDPRSRPPWVRTARTRRWSGAPGKFRSGLTALCRSRPCIRFRRWSAGGRLAGCRRLDRPEAVPHMTPYYLWDRLSVASSAEPSRAEHEHEPHTTGGSQTQGVGQRDEDQQYRRCDHHRDPPGPGAAGPR